MSEAFKCPRKIKNRPIRRKNSESDEDQQDDPVSILEEAKELQKLRERPHGVNVISLATGKKTDDEQHTNIKDPFKVETGGMLDMKALKSGKLMQNEDAYSVNIGTQFSAETNTRDEDEEMKRFVEEELKARKGSSDVPTEETKRIFATPDEAAFHAIPEYLRKSSSSKSEEMLSSQMLTGIPEVDLGIEVKIKNIEATEEAKQKMLAERMKKKEAPSQFVPTNIAANFVQNHKLNQEDVTQKKKRRNDDAEKATDFHHYEKFKKNFKR